MRKLVGATFVGVLLISIALLASYALKSRSKFNIRLDNSIVRLHRASSGQFFCSGTVINETAIVTAAHCVVIETPFGAFVDEDMEIEVRDQTGAATGIIAKIRNINDRLDTALLLGDFSKFQARGIEDNPAEIDKILLDPESKLVTCGYPLGGPLVCNSLSKVQHYFFQYSAQGWLYPGMSGGPVIDLKTGKVLAVNRAVDQTQIIFNPLVDFFYDMLHG